MPVHLARLSTLTQMHNHHPRYCATVPDPVQVQLAVYTNMGAAVASCKLGVRFRIRTCQFTRQWEALWCEWHFRSPAALSNTPPGPLASYKSH